MLIADSIVRYLVCFLPIHVVAKCVSSLPIHVVVQSTPLHPYMWLYNLLISVLVKAEVASVHYSVSVGVVLWYGFQ